MVIATTKTVRNVKTVPMPASMSVRPWSISVSGTTDSHLARTANYTESGPSCPAFDKCRNARHHCRMRLTPVILVLLLSAAAAEEGASPPKFEGATIGKISIERQNVFDLSNAAEDNGLYRLMNRLHIVTREKVVTKQLLFEAGEPYTQQLIDESERILRANKYLFDATINGTRQDDGTIDVTVRTRDVWTLGPELSYTRSGGENKIILSLEEDNLLGYGSRVLISRSKDVDRTSNRFEFSDRQLGQSWVSMALRIANNSDGHSNLLSIIKPFHALDARGAAGGFVLDDDRRSALYVLGNEAAEYRHERDNISAFGGWSSGLKNRWVARWTTGVVYDDNRFSAVANPTLPAVIPSDRKLVYPFIGIEILEDQFEKSTNSDQMERYEDFYFGTRVSARLGWSDTAFGANRNALVYTTTANKGFGSMDRKALLITGNIRGRLESGDLANATLNVNARYYARQSEKRMFFARFNATAGQNLDIDNPIEIGGDTGLRGYPLRYQSGDSRVLISFEQRYFTDWYPFRLFRIGGAVFFDAGRTYGQDPLDGPKLGWLKDVGLGLRLSPTRFGTKKVFHVDIAFPLDGDPTIDNVQFLFEGKRSF